MKKTWLILVGIGVLCVLLVMRLLFVQRSGMNEEREWFVNALRYEFSARVDSVRMLNENNGRIWCRITAGNPQPHLEDSLKRLFKEHDMLYLIFRHSGDSILFIIPEKGKEIAKGDSIRISSSENTLQVFRNGRQVLINPLTSTLTGFSRPFFFKEKH